MCRTCHFHRTTFPRFSKQQSTTAALNLRTFKHPYLQPHCCWTIFHYVQALQRFHRVAPQPLCTVVRKLREVMRADQQRSTGSHRLQVQGPAGMMAVAAAKGVEHSTCVEVVVVCLTARMQQRTGCKKRVQ
jgi:hypothetical protein